MQFTEVNRNPIFTLEMSLEEAIDLWRIVDWASDQGNNKADVFVDALTEFASNSNRYSKYLD